MSCLVTAAVYSTKCLRLRHLHRRPQTQIGVMLGDVSAKPSVCMTGGVFSGQRPGQGVLLAWRAFA